MNAFIITNTVSGHTLGVYPGDTAYEAYEEMARDAGYDDVADLHEQTESDGSDMQIDALNASIEVHDAFVYHTIGSAGFVDLIEQTGCYDISRTEIERIALAVGELHAEDWERAEAFDAMWSDESWWRDEQCSAPDTPTVRAAMIAGYADTLARHTIDGMTENYTLNRDVPAEAEQADIDRAVADNWCDDWTSAADAVAIYCDTSVYGRDGQTLAPLSDDLLDAITARVDAWLTVARG